MKKITIKNYVWLLAILLGFTACNEDEYDYTPEPEPLPALTTGTADFSTYVALGASFTAGFTDNALFKAAQENSFPNILSQQFAFGGGGSFSQPLMNDNFGGLTVGGNRILQPRLVFGGAGPVPLESLIGPITVTTDILNVQPGPYNNMGVPGAKSFHLLANGYGNIANFPAAANPYFIRMASSPNASMLEDAMVQSPTFFTLSEIGGNDVLGYATSGGDGTNLITPTATFDAAFGALVTTLTSGGAKGVVTNVPYITDLPHFTAVGFNVIPLDANTASAVNNAYAPYNGGIQAAANALAGTGLFTQAEADSRMIAFAAGPNNAVVIVDETLTDLGAINPAFAGLPKYRQATANDLLVLSAASFIGSLADPNNPFSVNGVAVPLADKWVLLPSEQLEIKTATDSYNATISAMASSKGLALVDLNAILTQASTTGIMFDGYTMNTSLVFGGLVSLDGIHLTARGYALMANKFLEAIDATYGSNFVASGTRAKAGDYPTNYSPALQ